MRSAAKSVNLALCTVPDRDTARKIARALVKEKLAACVNLLPLAGSIYRWQGKIHEDRELLLLIKTTAARREALRKRLRALHPYEIPEILFLPVAAGDTPYLDWVAQSCIPQASRKKRR